MTNYKQKALEHVRSVCPEWFKPEHSICSAHQEALKKGCELCQSGWTAPHLEHWLRGIRSVREPEPRFWHKNTMLLDQHVHDDDNELEYNLDLDGENQDESFYKAYCEIVGI